MTEYWVSSAKHWCKFCQVWISGDRWNIQKHDQGRSHKERMEEYFKQKREDKRQGGLDDASLEKTLRQIEEAAVAAHAATATTDSSEPTSTGAIFRVSVPSPS